MRTPRVHIATAQGFHRDRREVSSLIILKTSNESVWTENFCANMLDRNIQMWPAYKGKSLIVDSPSAESEQVIMAVVAVHFAKIVCGPCLMAMDNGKPPCPTMRNQFARFDKDRKKIFQSVSSVRYPPERDDSHLSMYKEYSKEMGIMRVSMTGDADADLLELRRAFVLRAHELHPDKNNGADSFEDMVALIEARDTLRRAIERAVKLKKRDQAS